MIYFLVLYLYFNRVGEGRVMDTLYAVDCTEDGYVYPNMNDPRKYLLCDQGNPVNRQCPGMFVFGVKNEKCGPPKKASAINGKCPNGISISNYELHPLKQNPVYFIFCISGFIKFMFRCPRKRGNRQVFSGRLPDEIQSCRIPCKKKGNLPAALREDFLICNGRFGKLVTCPKGECFDHFNKVCSGTCLKMERLTYVGSNGFINELEHNSTTMHLRPGIGWRYPDRIVECINPTDKFYNFNKCGTFYMCKPEAPSLISYYCKDRSTDFFVNRDMCEKKIDNPASLVCPRSPCRAGNIEITTIPKYPRSVYLCMGNTIAYTRNCPQYYGLRWEFIKEGFGGRCAIICDGNLNQLYPDLRTPGKVYVKCTKANAQGVIMFCPEKQKFNFQKQACV